jgi:beta-lactamase regulating signal transducer with metallopeptidase domain
MEAITFEVSLQAEISGRKKEKKNMKPFNLSKLMRVSALALSLAFVLSAVPTLAQNNSGDASASQSSSSSANASKTTTTETTTTTSQATKPAQTTQTGTTTTAVDPIWLVVGGVGLLAILIIAILATRGRSRERVTAVHERKTVIEK